MGHPQKRWRDDRVKTAGSHRMQGASNHENCKYGKGLYEVPNGHFMADTLMMMTMTLVISRTRFVCIKIKKIE